jgi:hypothetical protein
MLVWRCKTALGKKLNMLREVLVGAPPEPEATDQPRGYRRGKPIFAGIGATIRWQGRKRSA